MRLYASAVARTEMKAKKTAKKIKKTEKAREEKKLSEKLLKAEENQSVRVRTLYAFCIPIYSTVLHHIAI